jgi:hypothetical protein
MYNKILKTLAFVVSLSFIATPVSATLITDTVFIGDREWAQVDLFTNLSWNDMDRVCPRGVCGSGTLNGFDMAGWTWASAATVGDLLFKPFSAHAGGISSTDWVSGEAVKKFVAATGMRAPLVSNVQGDRRVVDGITRDRVDGKYGRATMMEFHGRRGPYWYARTTVSSEITQDFRNVRTGVFIHRSVEVPEPSTLAIFALGMIGLASRRFKKQS